MARNLDPPCAICVLQDILQQYFLAMLAVESPAWHRPRAVDATLSLAYVRTLVNKGVRLDCEGYWDPVRGLVPPDAQRDRDAALAAAERERGLATVEPQEDIFTRSLSAPAADNQLLRLARFARAQLGLATI